MSAEKTDAVDKAPVFTGLRQFPLSQCLEDHQWRSRPDKERFETEVNAILHFSTNKEKGQKRSISILIVLLTILTLQLSTL